MRTFQRTLERTGVLQVDSVNVLQRAHYMPLYSRMGPYDVDLLRRAAEQRPAPGRGVLGARAGVHAGRAVAGDAAPDGRLPRQARQVGLRRRADDAARGEPARRAAPTAAPRPRATSTTGCRAAKDNWGWNWSETRRMLDYLYTSGQVAIAGRNSQFEIRYDLPERVIPAAVLARPTPDPRGGRPRAGPPGRPLPRRRDRPGPARLLPDAGGRHRGRGRGAGRGGRAAPGRRSQGWKRPAYLHRDARLPRRVGARALLSPFDPVVWERARTEALFDFHYRIEIYVPADKRVHGYYVLPFLLGDRIVGPGRPQGRPAVRHGPGGWSSRRRTPSPVRPPRPPRSSPPSCAGWPAGWAWPTIVDRASGRPGPGCAWYEPLGPLHAG